MYSSITSLTLHHYSITTHSTSLSRPSQSRPNSLTVGSINPAHRVTRRKSMSNTAAAAIKTASLEPGNSSARRSATSKNGGTFRGPQLGTSPSHPSSLPNNGHQFGPAGYAAAAGPNDGSAVVDGPALASLPQNEKGNSKARTRRASEGSRLSKSEAKRASGADLRCEKCGKGYKHSSCLTKHLSVPLILHLFPAHLHSLKLEKRTGPLSRRVNRDGIDVRISG